MANRPSMKAHRVYFGEEIMAAVLEDTPSHLRGNGRPVMEEHTITDLKVYGSIPSELDGRYVRTGANPHSGMSA